ncbi:hypothetical protein AB2L27_19270 [Kineococcus sp. LSe6-4]|uniref:MerR family transcriptional regulator n=1 Tax=Kineococcus halophytocola TaxID=3234027 RepID=A0ABV4H5Q2_9ACTN
MDAPAGAALDKLTLLQVSHRYDVDVATLHALVGRGALPAPTWSQGRLGWHEGEVRTRLRALTHRH